MLYQHKKSYKLYDVVDSLAESEIRQVRKILKSPFFTIRQDTLALFNLLVKVKKKQRAYPGPEDLFRQIFNHETFDYPKLRNTMSDLLELIEECWLINDRRSNKINSKTRLAKMYRQRNLEKSFSTTIKKVDSLLDNHDKRNANYFQQLIEIQEEKMNFQVSKKRTAGIYLQELSDTYDTFYLSQKLYLACAQLSHQLVYKTDYDYGLLTNLIALIEKEKYLNIPAIAIYYYCFRFLTEPDNLSYFEAFKKTLSNNQNEFNKEDLKAPFRLAINFCIRKTNEGHSSFIKDSWELYKEGFSEGILQEQNGIPRFTFNNAIAAALLLKEFKWVAQFIENEAQQLEAEFRNQTISFNLARLEFAKKNFSKALVHLQTAEYKDLVNNLISKMLLIKIYFELDEHETLQAQLESFGQFIRRREVSDYHRTNFLNVIRYIQKLISIPAYNKEARKKLQQQIKEATILSEKVWLLEKVENGI